MDPLRERLEQSDDPEALRRLVEDAKTGDRAGTVAFLGALYARRRSRAIHVALRELCTLPELEAFPPPEEAAVGRYGAAVLPRGPYPRMLGGLLRYPFSSRGACAVILFGGPVFSGALALLNLENGLFMVLPALVLGYFLAYGFAVVRESLEGRLAAPGWPDAGGVGEYVACFFRWWMSATVSFLPALVALSLWTGSIQGAESASALNHPALFVAAALALAGLVYYPMALLMAASLESALAPLDLPRGLRGMQKTGADYATAWACFAAPLLAGVAIQWAADLVPVASWAARLAIQVPVSWAQLYLLVVQMRALGLLYYARRDDLGWFR